MMMIFVGFTRDYSSSLLFYYSHASSRVTQNYISLEYHAFLGTETYWSIYFRGVHSEWRVTKTFHDFTPPSSIQYREPEEDRGVLECIS